MVSSKYKIEYETRYKSLLNDYTLYCITSQIDDNINIIDFAWDLIKTKTKTNNVKDIYVLIGIYKIPPCPACKNEILNQSEHMECPDGCLHDFNNCEDCHN